MSRLQEPRHHPAQPRPLRNRRPFVDEVAKHERSNSADDHGPRRSGATSRTRAEPCHARASSSQLRPAATRVRRVPWRDSEGASLGATRESASLGVSWCWTRCPLPRRSYPASVARSWSIPRNAPPASSRPGISPPSDSATSIEAAFADERDVARRLAQRCTPQPHSFPLLQNSLLRMRLSLPRFITSLHFCCAGWLLTRGRELSGERPRTLI